MPVQSSRPPGPSVRHGHRARKTAVAAVLFVIALAGALYLLLRPVALPTLARAVMPANPYRPSVAMVADPPPMPAASAAPGRSLAASEVAFCGVGPVSVQGLMDFLFNQADETRAVRTLLASLAANPNPRAQATALYLQAHEDFWNRDLKQQAMENLACDGVPDKPDTPINQVPVACRVAREHAGQRWQVSHAKALGPSMQLAQLARGSNDPQLLALAYNNCGVVDDAAAYSACQQGLLEQWSRVEPDNATPWLNLLSQARGAGGDSAAANALYHLSLAKYERNYAGMMAPWIAREVPAEQRTRDDQRLLDLATGTLFAAAMPSYGGLARSCSPASLQDANRRQLCNSAVEVLAGQPDTLMGLRVGLRLGQNLGWPKERLARLEAESQALGYAAIQQDERGQMSEPACAAQDRRQLYLRAVGDYGEVEAMRRQVAASGKSMEEMVQAFQRSDWGKQAAALLAASAASRPASP